MKVPGETKLRLWLSNDISLADLDQKFLLSKVEGSFHKYSIVAQGVKTITLREYLKQSKKFETVVVLFAGYNIERYKANLWKHLFFFFGAIYGMNIEGHLFKIPRMKAIVLILWQEVLRITFRIIGKLYELVVFGKSTIPPR